MPRGRTSSTLSLSERRAKAFDMFSEGFTIADVARRIHVTDETATRYKREFEDRIEQEALANPRLLNKTLENTMRAMEENDRIRRAAWEGYHQAKEDQVVECPHCEEDVLVPASSHSLLNQYLATLIKAQEQRAKLFNLFGVKQEYFNMVNTVRTAQEKLLEFMRSHLCATDREMLADFMVRELGSYMVDSPMPAIEASSQEIA